MGFEGKPKQQRQVGVSDVLIAGGQGSHEFQHLCGRQTTSRRGNLRTHFGIGLGLGQFQDICESGCRQIAGRLGIQSGHAKTTVHAILIPEKPRGPEADGGVGMRQAFTGASIIQGTHLIESPECTEGTATMIIFQQLLQERQGRRVLTFSEKLQGSRAVELIRMGQQGNELDRGFTFQIRIGLQLRILPA